MNVFFSQRGSAGPCLRESHPCSSWKAPGLRVSRAQGEPVSPLPTNRPSNDPSHQPYRPSFSLGHSVPLKLVSKAQAVLLETEHDSKSSARCIRADLGGDAGLPGSAWHLRKGAFGTALQRCAAIRPKWRRGKAPQRPQQRGHRPSDKGSEG